MTIEKLIKIQSELKSPKNQFNKFGNYNYRSCEDILEAVKPLLIKEGLFMTISDEVVLIGSHNYVKASVWIIGKDFEHSVNAFAREPESQKGMSDSQITGSSSSYARKYALNGMFCIDDTKDADSMDNSKIVPKTESKTETKQYLNNDERPWLNDKQFKAVCERAKNDLSVIDKTIDAFKIKKIWFNELIEIKRNAVNSKMDNEIFPDEPTQEPPF